MPTVLIVEDERGILEGLVRAVESTGVRAVAASGLAEGRALLAAHDIDCVLLDIRLKDGDGLAFLSELREGPHRDVPVIIATAYGDSDRTIDAIRRGAFDYVTKPFDLPTLLGAVDRALRQRGLARAPSAQPTETNAGAANSDLVGNSVAMLNVWKVIGRAAASDVPVLITGETGTGKELVARAIHQHSTRRDKPFIAVNLAALPPTLIESELFGHEKGAFTGASSRRAGRLEQAGAGTLFLDEIGDLDLALQTKLLRVLQDGRYERVGGSETLEHHARVIAATNRAVRPGAAGASLREDLYYRLAVLEAHVPPLRERRTDVSLLVARALAGTTARAVSDDAMRALEHYRWPGNVRELFHVIQRAAAMCGGEHIDVHDLPETIRAHANADDGSSGPAVADSRGASESERYDAMPLRDALASLEKRLIVRALEKSGGTRAEAARILGIARPQLYAKMEEHGLGGKKSPGGDA